MPRPWHRLWTLHLWGGFPSPTAWVLSSPREPGINRMTAEVDLVPFMGKSSRVEAVDVGSREMFEAMNKAIAFHAMRPVVDRLFGFSELREALNYLKEARHFGKTCLRA